MRGLTGILFVLVIATRMAGAGTVIQFSATPREFTGEGIVYQRLIFKQEDRTIHYQPPSHWRCSIDDNRLRLEPVNTQFAEAEISSAPFVTPAASDEAALAALAQQTVSNTPPASQEPAIVRTNLHPVLVDNNPSLEVVVSFKTMGDTFERGVIVMNTPATRIVFKLTARKRDFDPLYREFRASILTWQWQNESSNSTAPVATETNGHQ